MKQHVVIPKIVAAAEFAAMMDDANLGIGQWRKLVQYIKKYLQHVNFCVSETVWRELGEDHSKIMTGVYA